MACAVKGPKQKVVNGEKAVCAPVPVTKIPASTVKSAILCGPSTQLSLSGCGFSQHYFPLFNNIHHIDSNLQVLSPAYVPTEIILSCFFETLLEKPPELSKK